jgi:GT2 family glycosyltransferase
VSASSIIAITATYKRPSELARLLRSLANSSSPLHGIIVVDNGDDPLTRSAVEANPLTTYYLTPGRNLGCGGGLSLGERKAFELFPALTHIWVLDDDAVVCPDALEILLAAMQREDARMAHPLTIAADGSLGWFPGLLEAAKFRVICRRQTPQEFVTECGSDPIPFSWSQGIALLVDGRAFKTVGYHRDDFWVRGEDLEFSLRITHRFRGVYVPAARVQHLPPDGAPAAAGATEYAKHRAMLQNLAYTALRLPHGRPLLRTMPGNWLRFLRTWGWRPQVVANAISALIEGALLGKPAGARRSVPLVT